MKIALIGYGKMGKMIEALLLRSGKHEVVLKITSASRSTLTTEKLKQADVAIEFTNPAVATENIRLCLDAGVPVVVGTTGWYDQLNALKEYCQSKNGSVIYASNFSIGVNLFFEMNRKLAQIMKQQPQYEPRITEIHHIQKKDAPSGTAISLAKDLINVSGKKKHWTNILNPADGVSGASPEELIILSLREENVVGVHVVEYTSRDDKMELKHEAFSREGFASGAVLAAEWIAGKKGMFEFREIINQL